MCLPCLEWFSGGRCALYQNLPEYHRHEQHPIVYDVRDLDSSADDAVQQVALHYRVGSSGNFINVPAAYIADATTGPSLASLVTSIDVALPSAVNDQSHVELRIMTTNSAGNDEWIGIDTISITANYPPTTLSLSPNSVLENRPVGTTVGTLTTTDPKGSDTHTFTLVSSTSCTSNGADNANFSVIGNTLRTSVSSIMKPDPVTWFVSKLPTITGSHLLGSAL